MLRFFKSLSTLQWALGLSLLLHAVILTIRFVDPEGFQRVFQDTTLDVVLVNAKSDEKPDKAQAIAQANLAGGGEAEGKRLASTPLPPSLTESTGDAPVNENQRRIDNMLEQQEMLLAQVRQQLAAMPKVDPQKNPVGWAAAKTVREHPYAKRVPAPIRGPAPRRAAGAVFQCAPRRCAPHREGARTEVGCFARCMARIAFAAPARCARWPRQPLGARGTVAGRGVRRLAIAHCNGARRCQAGAKAVLPH